MNDSSKRHSQFLSLIFILNCLSKASVIIIGSYLDYLLKNLRISIENLNHSVLDLATKPITQKVQTCFWHAQSLFSSRGAFRMLQGTILDCSAAFVLTSHRFIQKCFEMTRMNRLWLTQLVFIVSIKLISGLSSVPGSRATLAETFPSWEGTLLTGP